MFETPLLDSLHNPVTSEEMDWLATTYFAFEPFLGNGTADQAPEETQELSHEILNLVTLDPERAWPIVIELVERAPDDAVLGWVGASLVEHIVQYHGLQFADRVEQRLLESRKFHRATHFIYWNEGDPTTMSRLRPLANRQWSALREG